MQRCWVWAPCQTTTSAGWRGGLQRRRRSQRDGVLRAHAPPQPRAHGRAPQVARRRRVAGLAVPLHQLGLAAGDVRVGIVELLFSFSLFIPFFLEKVVVHTGLERDWWLIGRWIPYYVLMCTPPFLPNCCLN